MIVAETALIAWKMMLLRMHYDSHKTEHLLLGQLLDFVVCWMLENTHCSIEFAQFQAAAEVEAVAVTKKLIQIICKIPRFLQSKHPCPSVRGPTKIS